MVANRQRPTWREEEHIVEKIKRTLLDPGIVNVARLDRDLIFQLNKDPELDNEVWYVCVKRAAAEWKLRKDYLGGNEASTDSSQPVNKALRPRSSAAKSQPPSVASPTVKTDCADRTVRKQHLLSPSMAVPSVVIYPSIEYSFDHGGDCMRQHIFVHLPQGIGGEQNVKPKFSTNREAIVINVQLPSLFLDPRQLYSKRVFHAQYKADTDYMSPPMIAYKAIIDAMAAGKDKIEFEIKIPLPSNDLEFTEPKKARHKSWMVLKSVPKGADENTKKTKAKWYLFMDLSKRSGSKSKGISDRKAASAPQIWD